MAKVHSNVSDVQSIQQSNFEDSEDEFFDAQAETDLDANNFSARSDNDSGTAETGIGGYFRENFNRLAGLSSLFMTTINYITNAVERLRDTGIPSKVNRALELLPSSLRIWMVGNTIVEQLMADHGFSYKGAWLRTIFVMAVACQVATVLVMILLLFYDRELSLELFMAFRAFLLDLFHSLVDALPVPVKNALSNKPIISSSG